jgi:hopanoid biosynthesis associated protein HpnK
MMGGAAVEDAVFRAKRMPRLRVGLHVAVTDARPVSDPATIPLLVNARGEFSKNFLERGMRFAFGRGVRGQLAAEIRAQFQAFAASGLVMDHINGHNHMHVHPVVFDLMLRIGSEFGVRAVRIPYEPFGPSWRAAHRDLAARFGYGVALSPLTAWMRTRARRSGFVTNDYLFGIADTGGMTAERVLRLLANLPHGVSEFHFHPATGSWPGIHPGARYEEELAALTSPQVAAAIQAAGIETTTFGELALQGRA